MIDAVVSPHRPFLDEISHAETRLGEADPVLKGVMEHLGPCDWQSYRMEPFDALVWSVIGQQISVKAVAKIHQRVRQLAGESITPEGILRNSAQQLRQAGLSGSKAATVLEIARHFSAGHLAVNEYGGLTDAEVMAKVCQVKGIGPWTAEMFLIFGLGRLDVFSARDLGLRKAVRHVWQLPALPSVEHCELLAENWRPWRTVAAWYLWRMVD